MKQQIIAIGKQESRNDFKHFEKELLKVCIKQLKSRNPVHVQSFNTLCSLNYYSIPYPLIDETFSNPNPSLLLWTGPCLPSQADHVAPSNLHHFNLPDERCEGKYWQLD